MKKNSSAFVLIKSLSMSEKRYFKIFSERHTIGSKNRYLTLFDELEKLSVEDDELIKKKLREKGIKPDFLSADKNYLYRLILRSLNDFHYSRTSTIKMKEALLSIEILYHKALYQECLKLTEKALLAAGESENHQLIIDLLVWKKKCNGYAFGIHKAAEVNIPIDHNIKILNNFRQISDLYYRSYILMTKYEKNLKGSEPKEFSNILSAKILSSENNALSFSAKIFFHLIYAHYYHVLGKTDNELKSLEKLASLINSSKTYGLENPLDYVSIYNRLLAVKKYYSAASFFNDIKVLKEFCSNIQIQKNVVLQRVFIHTHTHELEYYLINNDFESAGKMHKLIERGISRQSHPVEEFHLIYFYYLLGLTLACLGDFRGALKYINKIINNYDSDERPQVFLRSEILNLIIHFELRNFALVKTLSRQLLEKNMNKSLMIPFEKKLITTILSIANLDPFSIKSERELLNSLSANLSKEKAFRSENLNIHLDNYKKWVLAKVNQRTILEIFDKKPRQLN